MNFSWYEIAGAQREFSSSFSTLQTPHRCPHNIHPAVSSIVLNRTSHADAFIRDELSKGRYDPPVADITFEMMMELFGRTLRSDLGPREGGEAKVEDVC